MNATDVIADGVVEVPDVRRRHRDVLREAAVTIDADDLRVGTHVSVAGAAQKTSAVDDMSLCRYAISFLDIGDEVSHFNDVAGKFVTDDERRLASPARPIIPVVDVNVGAAYPGAADLYQNFVVSDLRLGYIAEHYPRCRSLFY
jgi:hypothetical protein